MNLSSFGLKLRSASVAEVEYVNTTSGRKQLGIKRMTSALWWQQSVARSPLSLCWLEDAGWTF